MVGRRKEGALDSSNVFVKGKSHGKLSNICCRCEVDTDKDQTRTLQKEGERSRFLLCVFKLV